jgi:thymidylate kinase
MPAARAASRIKRQADRMEAQGFEYLEQVRQGFLGEARRSPQQIIVLDADRPPANIHADVLREVERLLS